MGGLCATWHKGIPKSTNFKIKTRKLIQKCHAPLNYNAPIQKWCVHALKLHYGLNYNDAQQDLEG